MKSYARKMLGLPVAIAVLLVVAAMPVAAGEDEEECGFADAVIFFELNNTDGDLGIHALIDGDPWKLLQIESPDEQKKLKIGTRGSLRAHGLTELFFESAEPTFDELPPERFFRRFQEGYWEVEGVTIEGEEIECSTFLSHVIPAAPEGIEVNGEEVPEDCEEGPVPSVDGSNGLLITWDEVEDNHPELGKDGEVEVELYQVVLELEEADITVDVSAETTELLIAPGLYSPGEQIKVEILVREETGNQSATESCFAIEGDE